MQILTAANLWLSRLLSAALALAASDRPETFRVLAMRAATLALSASEAAASFEK